MAGIFGSTGVTTGGVTMGGVTTGVSGVSTPATGELVPNTPGSPEAPPVASGLTKLAAARRSVPPAFAAGQPTQPAGANGYNVDAALKLSVPVLVKAPGMEASGRLLTLVNSSASDGKRLTPVLASSLGRLRW